MTVNLKIMTIISKITIFILKNDRFFSNYDRYFEKFPFKTRFDSKCTRFIDEFHKKRDDKIYLST